MPRKAKTSRAEILRAALRVADNEGIDGLTMRKIGESLGVEAMSLYNHVPNKAAVLDGLHELILSEVPEVEPSGDWRRDAKTMAMLVYRALTRHPRVTVLFARRPATTSESLRYLERGLAILAEPFPEIAERVYAFQTVFKLVLGHAMTHLSDATEGVDYAGLPAAEYPTLVGAADELAKLSVQRELEFGLDAMFDGFAARAKTGSECRES
jgi:TetR/AcrR family tetracycline transcriptional repressor